MEPELDFAFLAEAADAVSGSDAKKRMIREWWDKATSLLKDVEFDRSWAVWVASTHRQYRQMVQKCKFFTRILGFDFLQ
jgi:hypothetical protein